MEDLPQPQPEPQPETEPQPQPQVAPTLPYGEWPSPLTAAVIAESVSSVGEIIADGPRLWWSEHHPSQGRTLIMCLDEQGVVFEATPPQANVRTRVHEYGGAAWWVSGGVCVYSDDSDGQLRRLDLGASAGAAGEAALGEPMRLTWDEASGGFPHQEPSHQDSSRQDRQQQEPPQSSPPHQNRWADFRFTPDGKWLVGVRERHSSDHSPVLNEIAAVAMDGSNNVVVLVSGADFYAAPRVSPDGQRLAWLSWDLPDMPWDSTQLWVAEIDLSGEIPRVGRSRQLAGQTKSDTSSAMPIPAGLLSIAPPASAPPSAMPIAPADQPPEWLFQPEWHQNNLYYVSERGTQTPDENSSPGVWSALWMCEFAKNGLGSAAPRCLLSQRKSEIQTPQWVFGESRFAIASTGLVWAASAPTGDKLCFGAGVSFTDCSSVSQVKAWKDGVIALVGHWDRSPEIVYFQRRGSQITTEVIRPASGPKFDSGFFPAPEPVSFADAHALYFAPAHPQVSAPSGTKPPLIVLAHGGPTAQARQELSWNRRYWTSRGFAVVDVNYRGSTGFGREYRNALRGLWGIADVADCVAAARYLCERGDVDPNRLAIIGGSAGGYSVLCALSFTDVFAAGVSRYGIADLEVLARDTHKFESRYLDSLVGPYPQRQDLYKQRSPIHHTKKLSCPMLILQGEQDKVVPPEQAELMVKALQKRKLPYAYLTFPDEGHGFRLARSQIKAREAELSFFGQIFGFVPADASDPNFAAVEISGAKS